MKKLLTLCVLGICCVTVAAGLYVLVRRSDVAAPTETQRTPSSSVPRTVEEDISAKTTTLDAPAHVVVVTERQRMFQMTPHKRVVALLQPNPSSAVRFARLEAREKRRGTPVTRDEPLVLSAQQILAASTE